MQDTFLDLHVLGTLEQTKQDIHGRGCSQVRARVRPTRKTCSHSLKRAQLVVLCDRSIGKSLGVKQLPFTTSYSRATSSG